jgi:hypothetical protein
LQVHLAAESDVIRSDPHHDERVLTPAASWRGLRPRRLPDTPARCTLGQVASKISDINPVLLG